jgi:hypothetical protein
MRPLLPALLPALLLAACGPNQRQPGPQPNETLFWRLTASSVEFGACTDSQELRGDEAFQVGNVEGSYLVYRVNEQANQATLMQCTALSASACTPTSMVLAVAGNELTLGASGKNPIAEGSPCNLAITQNLLIEDQGQSMRMTESLTFTLVDDPETCSEWNEGWKSISPNRMGLDGCTVSIVTEGVLD